MFVRRVPYQSVRRRRIRHWLLLMMRLAGAGAIVAGVRPSVLTRRGSRVSGRGAREVMVLVDRSYSMGYADRWRRAQAAARDAIDAWTPSTRASGVLRNGVGRGACSRSRPRTAARRSPPRRSRRGDALRAGAQARRQHPRGIDAAAPRGGADHRLPARRLARDRRRPPAGWHDAHAGLYRRRRHGQSRGHAGRASSARRSSTRSASPSPPA